MAPDLEFNNLYLEYNGIITHANIKDTKTDVSPLFPLKKLEEYLQVIPTTIATPKDEKKENMSFITIILNLFITLFKKK
ncbi:MAG: hypothetical protein ISS28_01195 [Candidatus Cloacimonetes bacterium]|nr:hypothetical protein [Actinomycetota bacterium]MBL7085704.1 hypothetical protein [Candidatus Cloacimonadota bacterium]